MALCFEFIKILMTVILHITVRARPKMKSNLYRSIVPRRSVRHVVRSVNYHINEWGNPEHPLLFLLHGWGDAGSTFQFLVDALKQDWFVVAPDWRGFGESEHTGPAYWFPDYVADFDAVLNEYSPDEPVRILGHSMGANIGALYAGIFPGRVAGLINIEGFGLTNKSPDDAPANFRRWIERSRKPDPYSSYSSFEDLAARIEKRTPHLTSERALFVARQWGREDSAGGVAIKADPAHKLPNAVLYRRAESEACWREVTAPVLLVVGDESEFKEGAQSWLDTDPASLTFQSMTVATIGKAGHMIHFEQPEALAHEAEAFFEHIAAC